MAATDTPTLFPLDEVSPPRYEPTDEELALARRVMTAVRTNLDADEDYVMAEEWDRFVPKIRMLNPQSYGKRVEKYLIRHLGWTAVPASADRGDARTVDEATAASDPDAGEYVEIKVSMLLRPGDNIHMVQIRPWQAVDGYRIFVVDADNVLHRLDLTAAQMKVEIAKYGSYAHGTKAVAKANAHAEYAIRFAWSDTDPTCVRWRKRYAVADPWAA